MCPGPCPPPTRGPTRPLEDEIETLDIVDIHPRHCPPAEATQLRKNLCYRHPVPGAPGGAEAKGRQVGPGLLPRNGIRQAHARPQPVDHGCDRERAGVQGSRRTFLEDEGTVALGQAGQPPTQTLHFLQKVCPGPRTLCGRAPCAGGGHPAGRQSWGLAGHGAHNGGGLPWDRVAYLRFIERQASCKSPSISAKSAVAVPSGLERKVTGGA